MKFDISFQPIRFDYDLIVRKDGDVLEVNANRFDFSVIPDGASLPAEAIIVKDQNMFVGEISRSGDTISLRLLLPYRPNPSYEVAFPEPTLATEDGYVRIPS
ncbi:hypothetical protein [uncultured Pseudomonas sp.]|uniref:hypothetical protein n=1 Tax=uncultured Pseudomonas sp. TaxID=114707 RepID=UPI0025D40C3A|nr:hypothetical protein [uncultured Pseudomonas sp.]